MKLKKKNKQKTTLKGMIVKRMEKTIHTTSVLPVMTEIIQVNMS